ncbi:MAG: helix-turn-helix domain-containing protein [Bacillaceae bacterium]
MMRAIIVEDEQIIRQGMIYTIDWESMNTEIVGEASNGKEGLEKILELKPDVVITDILMPIMNGIEMIEEAAKSHFFEKVILSSYSDFDYTKKSIQLQVFDYLLKPVDEEVLKTMMLSLAKRIEEKKQQSIFSKRMDSLSMLPEFLSEERVDTTYSVYTRKALECIKTRYSQKVNIEDLAAELNISPSYLSRIFKKETKGTFHYYLNQQRIKESIQLLLTNDYMIYEVAEKVGFSDYKQFNAVFRKYIGHSPTEFIQKLK